MDLGSNCEGTEQLSLIHIWILPRDLSKRGGLSPVFIRLYFLFPPGDALFGALCCRLFCKAVAAGRFHSGKPAACRNKKILRHLYPCRRTPVSLFIRFINDLSFIYQTQFFLCHLFHILLGLGVDVYKRQAS